jgi:pimeloyl-ACP methyl ester carboxylesterase
MMAGQSVPGVVAALRGMAGRPDRSALLPSIRVPTLVITGAEDTLIPVADSQAMAAIIPGSTLMILPDAGHLSNLEAPDGFNVAVRDLVARVAAG